MKAKRLWCVCLVFLYCIVYANTALATATDGQPPVKNEITALYFYDTLQDGVMLPINDRSALESAIGKWQNPDVLGMTADDDYAELELDSLDYSAIRMDTPGEYTVVVKLKLQPQDEEAFLLPDEIRTLNLRVLVTDPGLFDIWLTRTTSSIFQFGFLYAEQDANILYVTSPQPLTTAQLRAADWVESPSSLAFVGTSYFRVIRKYMTRDLHYYFKLRDGDVTSCIIRILDDGINGSFGGHVGDRDGGDSDGESPSDCVQPPPTDDSGNTPSPSPSASPPKNNDEKEVVDTFPPNEEQNTSVPPPTDNAAQDTAAPYTVRSISQTTVQNGSAAKNQAAGETIAVHPEQTQQIPFEEFFGQTTDIISGTRLRLMLENSGTATFSKQGITVTLSEKSLKTLDILDTDKVSVIVQPLSDTEFCFQFKINDNTVSTLQDTRIMFPYKAQQPGSEITVVHRDGTVAVCSYDVALDVCSFTTDQTGTVTILEQIIPLSSSPPPQNIQNYTALIALCIGGAAVCMLAFWLRKRRGKQ